MTAKEQLGPCRGPLRGRDTEVLRVLEERVRYDALSELLDDAPLDDEPADVDDDEDTQRAREEAARGEGVPLEQLRSELG